MARRKHARDLGSAVSIVVALAIVIFASLLADRGFVRWDLTEKKRYSLSQPFQKVLDKLESPLQVTYYVSAKVPAGFERPKQDILDKLGEIRTASRGKVKLEVLDPAGNQALLRKLVQKNPHVRIEARTLEKDRLSFAVMYSALQLTYEDQPPVLLPQIGRPGDLEYALANRILNFTQKEKPLIALQAPSPLAHFKPTGRRPPRSGFEWIGDPKVYGGKFTIERTDITEASPIPKRAKLLILVRPEKLSPRARYEVVKYLAEGGRVFLIANPHKVHLEFGTFEPSASGLEPYLERLGLRFSKGFLCDRSCVRLFASVDQTSGQVHFRQHPYYIRILPLNVRQENPITRYLPSLTTPFAAALHVDRERAKKQGLSVEVLATTSEHTWEVPFHTFFDENKPLPEPSAFAGPQPIFVQLEGSFPFPYEGKPVPAWSKSEKQEDGPAGKKEPRGKKGPLAQARRQPGRLLVWSSPESFHLLYLNSPNRSIRNAFRGNMQLFPNVVEINTLGEDLADIRAKSYETRTIKKYGDRTRTLIKVGLILGAPLLVLLFALARWRWRRGAQHRYERTFAATTGPSSFSP